MIDEVRLFKDINRRDYISKAMREIFETIIDEQPVLQTWIPVSERLPELKRDVFVQWHKTDRITGDTFIYFDQMWLEEDGEKIVFESPFGIPNGRVVAWIPLPEPYRPEPRKE